MRVATMYVHCDRMLRDMCMCVAHRLFSACVCTFFHCIHIWSIRNGPWVWLDRTSNLSFGKDGSRLV